MASSSLSTAITHRAYQKSSVNAVYGLRTVLPVDKFAKTSVNKLRARSAPAAKGSPVNGSRISMSMHEFSNHGSFNENDQNYVESTVVDSKEVKATKDGYVIRMADDRQVTCKHYSNNLLKSSEGDLEPAIVLRMEDGTGIMLPIIVLNHPAQLLKECLRNTPLIRPTVYQVMKDMAKFMGYELKLVRITHIISETYHARAYLSKTEGDTETIISLDMRPSDAINLATRAKVPIQVNKALACGYGVVPITAAPTRSIHAKYDKSGFNISNADRPVGDHCDIAEEFALVRSVAIAAILERYNEAARLRDELKMYRTTRLKSSTSDVKHLQ